jgi:hypothetical protein
MVTPSAVICMAPEVDPKVHRTRVTTDKVDKILVLIEAMNIDQAEEVAVDLVKNEGVNYIQLCPGFYYDAVARIKKAVGDDVIVVESRADTPNARKTIKLLFGE